jgi:hypothetical protein
VPAADEDRAVLVVIGVTGMGITTSISPGANRPSGLVRLLHLSQQVRRRSWRFGQRHLSSWQIMHNLIAHHTAQKRRDVERERERDPCDGLKDEIMRA